MRPGSRRRARRRDARTTRLLYVAALAVVVAVVGTLVGTVGERAEVRALAATTAPRAANDFTYTRLPDPDRTVVEDGSGTVVATLTDTARTVALVGPHRTFADAEWTSATIDSTTWVRLLPQPWTAGDERAPWFRGWLERALADTSPDVFTVATQYMTGAPEQRDARGVRVAGDAGFGPLDESTTGRAENSDFYDYLGVPWRFPDGRSEQPDPTRYGDVDCSGFLRLVWGYRMGFPLRDTDDPGPGLPRRARGIAEVGPGAVVIPDRAKPAVEYDRLQPGDLVFFNIDPGVDPRVDHAGIYLGVDDTGHHRFLSSRGRANGPTTGDVGGTSLLDDGEHYAQAFRTARRI